MSERDPIVGCDYAAAEGKAGFIATVRGRVDGDALIVSEVTVRHGLLTDEERSVVEATNSYPWREDAAERAKVVDPRGREATVLASQMLDALFESRWNTRMQARRGKR